ncbi:MAG: hypothetical protein V1836_03565 [Candidatus Aenigmatarchaeota archaeon]
MAKPVVKMQDYERKAETLRTALSYAKDSVDRGNYAAAFNYIAQANAMIPKRGGGMLGGVYGNAKKEIGILTRYVLSGAQQKLSDGYAKIDREMDRISHGGTPKPYARRTIKAMEGFVEAFTDPSMPAAVSKEFESHKDRVTKLKSELEKLAQSKGGKIDWDKP